MMVMNKIVIENEVIKDIFCDDSIEVLSESNNYSINQVKINVVKDTKIFIENNFGEAKMEFLFSVDSSVVCDVYESKVGSKGKFHYKYDLAEKSVLNVYRINDVDFIQERLSFNLNGDGAYLGYNFKTVGMFDEKYDVLVYHNASNTESLVNNNGVNKDGMISFNVSGFVPNGIKGCVLNQNGRIINLTDNKCQIKPNLFIDENDVIANHSAHIGKCNDDEIFYLMSRGISYEDSSNLIIQGFLLRNMNFLKKDMENIIDKYWR